MARRLAVAGVIRPHPQRPDCRKVAIVADWGHPRGPAYSVASWSVEADRAFIVAPICTLRGEALDHAFLCLADTLGALGTPEGDQ